MWIVLKGLAQIEMVGNRLSKTCSHWKARICKWGARVCQRKMISFERKPNPKRTAHRHYVLCNTSFNNWRKGTFYCCLLMRQGGKPFLVSSVRSSCEPNWDYTFPYKSVYTQLKSRLHNLSENCNIYNIIQYLWLCLYDHYTNPGFFT